MGEEIIKCTKCGSPMAREKEPIDWLKGKSNEDKEVIYPLYILLCSNPECDRWTHDEAKEVENE